MKRNSYYILPQSHLQVGKGYIFKTAVSSRADLYIINAIFVAWIENLVLVELFLFDQETFILNI